ncbi:hypothetical protein Dsin_025097 [Dipteronia sinensis]|uniref:Phytocyanin domain-containing protein n=1 Tax=Dipteronia sinensis TaxID=43782 RepID=A0AAE0DWM3_9ROSI|nr:hypothetical protein Dsin_025097 [Dipteronia sinensis]
MALAKSAVIFLMLLILAGVSMAAVYTVGDSTGWTIGPDYEKWANSKKFHNGDTLVFNYNSKIHNVMQMRQQDYNSCTTSSPIAVYTSGSDRITLKGSTHYYFICGFPGHCQSGQKVNIDIATPSTVSQQTPTASQKSDLDRSPSKV